jgi:hypothetical protein
MTRRADWAERLLATIEAQKGRPFAYGSLDCALFTARCVDAVLEDSAIETELTAAYTDEYSALKFMVAQGGLEAAVTKRFGEPIAPSFAQRGDVCLIPSGDTGALGICIGHLVAVMSPEGVGMARVGSALKAWRVR